MHLCGIVFTKMYAAPLQELHFCECVHKWTNYEKNEAVMRNKLILFGGNEFLKEGEKSTFNF